MKEEQKQPSWEERVRFVARRYREGALDTEAAWTGFASRYGIRRRSYLRRNLGVAAAVLLLLIGISGKYWMDKRSPEWITIVADAGKQKDVLLPDSTIVTLAGNSSVRYDRKQYGKERRAVMMTGKAWFRVAKDEARPFSVQTAQTLTEVLGTAFQLEEKERSVRLHVQTGKVRFSAGEENTPVILTEGMSAGYSEEEGMQVYEKDRDINYLSWKTRQLRFRKTPLRQVIRDVSETYQVEVTNHTEGSDELELTTFFDNLPLEELLSVINQTLDVHLEARPVN